MKLNLLFIDIKPLGRFYLLLFLIFSVYSAIDSFVVDISYAEWWLMPLLAAIQLVQFVLLQRGFSESFLSQFNIVFCLVILQVVVIYKIDYYHVVVFWAGILPMLVTATMRNRWQHYFWFLIFVVFLVSNGLYADYVFDSKYEVEVFPIRFMVSGVMFLFLIIFVSLVYHQLRNDQESKLDEKNNRLLQQKRDLVKLNQKLTEQHETLKKAQRQLIQSEKMASIGFLSAGIGHEINNPLQFIKSGVDGMLSELEKNDYDLKPVEPFIVAINEGVGRASGIVKSLSHFSRQSTKMNEQCDIHNILDNCLSILNNKIRYKAQVIKHYHQDNIVIIGNEGKLHQAFLNLIANAEQAIERDGVIEVWTKVNKRLIQVGVKDNGQGIDDYNLSKIHDPFFTTKEPGVGTGLGLAITYQIIEEHHGLIDIESNKGTGTEFTISFPEV